MKELERDGDAAFEKHDLSYLEDKELLQVDRKIISLGQTAVSSSRNAKNIINEMPSKLLNLAERSYSFTKEALGHLGQAQNLRDLVGIGMYEVRRALMEAQSNHDVLQKSTLLEGGISWLVTLNTLLLVLYSLKHYLN